jgi:exodeoxyribonuclease VII small subunit
MTSDETSTPSFTEALEELEQILRRIEGEETDIDALASELKRATELLELARGKLRKAEVEVTQIVQSLDEESGEIDAEDDEDDDLEPDVEESAEEDDIPF